MLFSKRDILFSLVRPLHHHPIVFREKNKNVDMLGYKQIPWLLPPFPNKSLAPASVHSFGAMAFLPAWTCVLAGCFSASLAGVSNVPDLYPPLWRTSAGRFSDYRVENGKYVIDPWVYNERMGMYKILVNTTASYFENIVANNDQNILWGLPLQHGWQYRTGKNDSCFHPDEIWPCSNWEISLCIYHTMFL